MLRTVIAALAAVTMLSACVSSQSTTMGFSYAENTRLERAAKQRELAEEAYRNRQPTAAEQTQIDCLAENMYFEARGESQEGQTAVAHVTMNRARSGLFPASVCGVVYESNNRGCQFSWTCDGHSDRIRDRETFTRIEELAKQMFLNTPPDNTGNALFYHANYVNPRWSRAFDRTVQIGAHIFYASTTR